MSRFEPAEVTCARCGTVMTVQAADSLHVTNLPSVREAALRGELHLFDCTGCQAKVRLEKLLAYTDFERKHWFAVFPDKARRKWQEAVDFAEQSFAATMEERAPPLVQSWAPTFRKSMRAIFGLDSLRDKLTAYDAGLDDRVLELVKLEAVRIFDLPWHEGAALWFLRCHDAQLEFAYCPASGPNASEPQPVTLPLELYQRRALDPAVRELAPELFASIAVDLRLVLRSNP